MHILVVTLSRCQGLYKITPKSLEEYCWHHVALSQSVLSVSKSAMQCLLMQSLRKHHQGVGPVYPGLQGVHMSRNPVQVWDTCFGGLDKLLSYPCYAESL